MLLRGKRGEFVTLQKFATSAHLTKRILARTMSATAEQTEQGKGWYSSAREEVADLATLGGLTKHEVAGIIAALSPQTRWEANLDGARRLVSAKRGRKRLPSGVTLYTTNAKKAWKIASGTQPWAVLSGRKVVPFYYNLAGDETYVTVDTWIWKGTGLTGTLTDAKVRSIQRAYEVVARKMQVTPAQAQAIDWVVIRGKAN